MRRIIGSFHLHEHTYASDIVQNDERNRSKRTEITLVRSIFDSFGREIDNSPVRCTVSFLLLINQVR